MYYTKAMIDTLRSLDSPEAIELLSYYLDNYFINYEEPQFSSAELKKVWYLLLIDGLIAEAKRGGSNRRSAMIMLKEMLNINSVIYKEHEKEVLPVTLIRYRKRQAISRESNRRCREFKKLRRLKNEDLQEQEQERI